MSVSRAIIRLACEPWAQHIVKGLYLMIPLTNWKRGLKPLFTIFVKIWQWITFWGQPIGVCRLVCLTFKGGQMWCIQLLVSWKQAAVKSSWRRKHVKKNKADRCVGVSSGNTGMPSTSRMRKMNEWTVAIEITFLLSYLFNLYKCIY